MILISYTFFCNSLRTKKFLASITSLFEDIYLGLKYDMRFIQRRSELACQFIFPDFETTKLGRQKITI